MIINDVRVDPRKLLTKHELLNILREEGETDRVLSKIRDQYFEVFGNELMWRYPYSDGKHLGVVIVVVQEGFLSLPYDSTDKEVYEIFELDDISMFDVESLEYFIEDYNSISKDLVGAMGDMLSHLRAQN